MPNPPVRDPKRWEQIEHIFNQALDRDPTERADFLAQACGTDAELLTEVESLLASLDESAPFIASAIEDAAATYLQRHSGPELPEGTMLGQYRVLRQLASGGMGTVYLAADTRLKRQVALKVFPPSARNNTTLLRRFEQEARILSGLNHPNLITIFDFCTVEGVSFLVTELVEGVSLRDRLKSGPLPFDSAVDVARQVAAALNAAHAAGVIHRDIKPENIMLRPDGCVKVLDFGIAKLANKKIAENITLTSGSGRSAALGTPRYMSPEQARGMAQDERGDIFSFGAVFYELLAGKAAFRGNNYGDLIADILRGRPKPLPRRAGRFAQRIVNRCLEKEPDRRYPSASALLQDVQKLQQRHQRSPQLLALQVGLIAALALIAFLTVHRLQSPKPHGEPQTLAVLPFRNLNPSPDTDFLAFSLADQVIARLDYVKALVLRPASSVADFRGASDTDLSAIAAKLKAQLLLTGTYRKDGQELRISARLVSFSPEQVLWQKTAIVPYDNLRAVRDRVADMIISGLSLQLGPEEKQLLKTDPAVNSVAYEYYLRGVDLYALSDFAGSIRMLEKSVAIDPKYAPTWAQLGRAYTTNASLQFGGLADYRRAEQAYDNAISLNPALPEPRVYMANLLTDTGRVEESVRLLRVALESSPNNAEAHWELGYAYRFGGMLQESVTECETARRLDPEVKINSSALNSYLYLGEYDKFLQSLPPNDSPYLVFYHGFGEYYKKDFAAASADFDRAFDLAPNLLPAQIGKALSENLQHATQGGLARLHATEQSASKAGVRDAEGFYKLAQAYAQLGDHPDAIRVLDLSINGGFFCYPYISTDPLLSSLHGEARFTKLMQKAKERWRQFRQRFAAQGDQA